MSASRVLPRVGLRGEVVHVGRHDPCEVVAVAGASLTVALDRDGSRLTFALHPMTAHWVQEGEPYYGPRFVPVTPARTGTTTP